jgi:CheY-like chemotaxis protein
MGRFPCHNFVQDPEPVRLVLNSKQEKAISQQSIIRTLVVDDFAPWRRFVCTIAQIEPGWHVISEAADGLEAVRRTEELTPDLILLDISLPRLNGIEAARQIRKVTPNFKIVFVSTYASWEIRRSQKMNMRSRLSARNTQPFIGRESASASLAQKAGDASL